MVVACLLPGEKAKVAVGETRLWSKYFDSSLRFDQSSWWNVDGNFQSSNSSTSKWGGGEEAMDACKSGISKCFLVPMWWGGSSSSSLSSGQAIHSATHHHDRVHKHLVLSHGTNGPSARIVLWRNYMGFDCKEVRRNLGAIIRAYDARRQFSEVEDVENENQSLLGSMLGTAVSTYVSSQLEHCAEMEVRVAGSTREILKGQVRNVKITAKEVIYKGVALSDVAISAKSIQVKLGKRRLLQSPLQVKALVSISEKDLKASLASPLLVNCLKDILPEQFRTADGLAGIKVGLQDGLMLVTERKGRADLGQTSAEWKASPTSVALSFDLMNGGKTVHIRNAAGEEYQQADDSVPGRSFNMGSETCIKKLDVIDSRLVVGGEFCIIPS